MPLYAYKGVARSGKAMSGVLEADSPKVLRQQLRKDGVVVTDFGVSKGGKSAKVHGKGLSRDVKLGDLFSKVKRPEIAAFTRQLSTLLRAGIPLAESLQALFEQTEEGKFKPIVGEVRTAVNEGSSLANAMAKHTAAFDNLYTSMVRAGEEAGNLETVLSRLAEFLEGSEKLKGKLQGAMIYPVIMAVVGVAVMMFMMIVVVPKITKIFEQRGQTLPLNTRMLVWTSEFVGEWWYMLIVAAILVGWGFLAWIKTPGGRETWDGFKLRMWLFGPLIRRVAIARFSRTLGTMLQAGVPLLKALDTAKEVLGNVILQKVIDEAKVGVTEGESLASKLRKSGQFPAAITHMIAVGERSGQLEQMLQRAADAFEEESQMKIDKLTATLEPLMIVVMAVGVGFVVISMLQPMLEMTSFGR